MIIENIYYLHFSENATNLEKFQLSISKQELYRVDDPVVNALLSDMANLPILHVGKYIHKKV